MNLKPWMDNREIKLIESYLTKDDIMLEWGCGGSTLYFPKFVNKYYSIEHNKEWFEKIKKEVFDNVNINYVSNNLPRTHPTKKEQFLDYINSVDNLGVNKFDKVLIDGRARNFCAEKIIPYLKEDSVVFIHDFWKRYRYHNVFNWYKEVDSIKNTNQTLVALKLK